MGAAGCRRDRRGTAASSAEVLQGGLPGDLLEKARRLRIDPGRVRIADRRFPIDGREDGARGQVGAGKARMPLVRVVEVDLRMLRNRLPKDQPGGNHYPGVRVARDGDLLL